MYSESFDDSRAKFSCHSWPQSVIIAQQLEPPLLMSEEVARAAAGGKACGGGLKVVQASADRLGNG
jgi:hypothetical protein